MSIEIHDIDDLRGCQAVVAVQEAVWGAESEIVPPSVLVASIKRGGILLGAYGDDRLVGFVWSMPGWLNQVRTQWSHMLAVLPDARGARIGERLKWAQRERALEQGVTLIEWTFDPLQALNAHLNVSVLGCVSNEYLVDAYGELAGPLHRGTPTDRLIASWWIDAKDLARRKAARDLEMAQPAPTPATRPVDLTPMPHAIDRLPTSQWEACGMVRTDLDAPWVQVSIPARFGEMQQSETELALAWRLATREAFRTYFARGYGVVDFFLNRERGGGEYLLSKAEQT
jgi:predicted GNAT superfamily acetyltransferase